MFFQWYRYCFSKYFTFQGRASRTEYWSFTIINATEPKYNEPRIKE